MSFVPSQTDSTAEELLEEATKLRSGSEPQIERRRCHDRRQASRRAHNQDSSRPANNKDNWDKVAALAPIISGFLIFIAGGLFTYAFNQQQLRLQEAQTIEKFIPHLMGSEQSKKAAILAISSLGDAQLAAKIASVFASSGTVSALQSMAVSGSEKEKSIATKALSDALENLAARESKLSDIELAYKQALEASQSKAMSVQKDLPASLSHLADLYRQRGQLVTAETLYKKVAADQEKSLGADHPLVAETLKGLATVYQAEGKKQNADEALRRAKEIEARCMPLPKAEGEQQAASSKEQGVESERTKDSESETAGNNDAASKSAGADPVESARQAHSSM